MTSDRQCEICQCFLKDQEWDRCDDCNEHHGLCPACGEVLNDDGVCDFHYTDEGDNDDVDELTEWADYDPDC